MIEKKKAYELKAINKKKLQLCSYINHDIMQEGKDEYKI